ncbi:MAG: hypothetical protein HY039_11750 [Nitrospirae bacterium]|nr:hypothetical protein [Nitrospirota bacterium]
MRFSSIGAVLAWYATAREGAPRATRLEPTASIPRRASSSPGATLTTVCEVGKALSTLAEIERAVLHLRHVENLSIEAIREKLSRRYRRRFLRRVVERDLGEAEVALDEELRRRGLLGGESDSGD